MASSTKPSILLIHGLWMTPLCWEDWIAYYEKKGYNVIAPGWPGVDDRTPQEIRANPKPLEGLNIGQIIDRYTSVINNLPTLPIIMGHSFGGLFTQILISRGLGAAGVAICPAQPAGVLALAPSTIKAGWGILGNPLTYNAAVPFSEEQFHYSFGNHLSKEDSKVLWEKYAIPSAAHILWQGALSSVHKGGDAHVEFDKPDRAPLLLIAGTKDHVLPPKTVEAELHHYKGPAKVEMKCFEGRTHGIVNQKGWEEVADYALNFVEEHLGLKK